jgi:hypothetical protein
MKIGVLCLVAAPLLAGCYKVDSLEGTQAEPITVEGRKFTVRVAPTGTPDQYRLLVQRSTMVINPDYELESDRARNVARIIMERTCKGRPYSQAVDGMEGVNYKTVFSCLQA